MICNSTGARGFSERQGPDCKSPLPPILLLQVSIETPLWSPSQWRRQAKGWHFQLHRPISSQTKSTTISPYLYVSVYNLYVVVLFSCLYRCVCKLKGNVYGVVFIEKQTKTSESAVGTKGSMGRSVVATNHEAPLPETPFNMANTAVLVL